ncbi:MAG: hypothetical protein ACI80V_001530 [Rhodothermales bacterium]|jgi:hypothetical protein
MSLTLGLSPWLLALLLGLVAAGAVWLYHGTVPKVEGAGRIGLSVLRFLSMGILVFLLVEPLLTRETQEEDRPVIAVLLDDSQSVNVASDSVGRGEVIAAAAALQGELQGADLRFFRFGSTLTAVESIPDPSLDSTLFSAGRTDISRALDEAAEELRETNLQAVVLISDGRYNTGRNPIHLADRFAVPINTITVGDTTARRDVQVRRVQTNELAYRNTALPIEVGVRHNGFPNQRVTVRVSSQGAVLDQEQVNLPAQDGEASVRLEVTPDTTGLVRYTISVSRSDGEFTFRNNTAGVSVQVVESKRRILLLGGNPGPDLAALRSALVVDEETELDFFVRRPSGGYFQGAMPLLDDYDLIVLAGYPSAGTDIGDLDRIASAVSDGTPILFAMGHGTDLQLMQRLGASLPVQPRVLRSGRTEGTLVLAAAGRRHPIFDLPADVPGDAWESLPPLTLTDVSWQVAPDAQVLGTALIRGVGLDDPAIVVRRRAGARSAALLASGAWRWGNLPESLQLYDPVWPGLVSNLVQWLAAPEDDRPVRIRPTRTAFEGGESVEFSGQVYDESAQPVSGATVDIELRTPDGSVLPFAMRAIGSGRYRATAGVLPEGSYSFSALARADDAEIGSDRGAFSVGPLGLEFRDTQADLALMRQLALRSGGQAMTASTRQGLGTSMRTGGSFNNRTRVVESSFRLWQRYPFMIVVLVLLTVEWFLRKRRGLV